MGTQEGAERAAVVRQLLRQLAKVGINPDEGFTAEWTGREWIFYADADDLAQLLPMQEDKNAPKIHTPQGTPQKR